MKFDNYIKIMLTVIAFCLIWLCVKDVNITLPVRAESPAVQVTSYRLAWNKNTSQGEVDLLFSNGQKPKVKISSAADLAGWAAVLSQKPVYVNDAGWIFTGAEVPGE